MLFESSEHVSTKHDFCQPYVGVLWHLHMRESGDAAMLAGYLGNSDTLDNVLCKFVFSYTDQTEKDFNGLVMAVNSGRIIASHES